MSRAGACRGVRHAGRGGGNGFDHSRRSDVLVARMRVARGRYIAAGRRYNYYFSAGTLYTTPFTRTTTPSGMLRNGRSTALFLAKSNHFSVNGSTTMAFFSSSTVTEGSIHVPCLK